MHWSQFSDPVGFETFYLINANESLNEFVKLMSRYDNVNAKGKMKLGDIKRPIIKTYFESKIPFLFDNLLKKREHISLAIDEYGAVRGVVTLEDIIETLLGLEIVDETDTVVDLQFLAKKRRRKLLRKNK